ncbi:PucR family transcriptional regulator [Nonomuraea sp. NPDC050328]|uniref:PucR family transcriptional regulator n=1 Tax=Nonomuraea sp. NPDC050328 TaxID=3364361 RepID=UPI003796077A
MKAAGWESPVTVAELVDAGPLAGATMYGTGENPVHQVRIVDELPVLSTVVPHTAVVLIGSAASGGWAVEMAMRRAWEQAAACVIAPASAVSAGSGELLAERLGVTLVFVEEDPLVTAVRVASAAARPEAARTQLVARCATRLAEAGLSARRVLGVLNAELPGTSVAFVDGYGRRLAGRVAPDRANLLAEVPVPGPELARTGLNRPAGRAELDSGGRAAILGTLVAAGSARSAGWPSVVATVLGLAVAPLTAWAATERLAAAQDFDLQAALGERLLAALDPAPPSTPESAASPAGEEPWARAVALGWPVQGPVTAFWIRQAEPATPTGEPSAGPEPDAGPQVRAVLAATVGEVPVLPRGRSWAGWSARPPADLAAALQRAVGSLPWLAAAGAGAQVTDPAALAESLPGARAAAFVAGPGTVARADRMGPAELLAALPAGVLSAPAEVVLGPLLAVDKDGTLVETVRAVLEEGGALKAAERLGVHRNTVTTRLDRVRAAGFDLDDPPTRLALLLATHLHKKSTM